MDLSATTVDPTPPADPLTIGRRVRHVRTGRGETLAGLAAAVGRAPSQISMLENGLREPRLSLLASVAEHLGTTLAELLEPAAPTRRASLEIALERHQRGSAFADLALPRVKAGPSLPTEALETIVALQEELLRLHRERAATPEEARRANAELRTTMREQHNYFPHLETAARELLGAVGHTGGPLSQRSAADLAGHLGFTLHHVPNLPRSTRSVTDLAHHRVYLPQRRVDATTDPRSSLLQALAGHVLGHGEPDGYAALLAQRVEANYLAAALMVPEDGAASLLTEAKRSRSLSVEDLRDAFAVPYETAAHRFTNLATQHLGVPVHFMKVDRAGIIHKAYENDGVSFPTDTLGAVEGQPVCRHWTARVVFSVPDQLSPYSQYTDTPSGTYWCTSRTQAAEGVEHSISVGVPFAHVRWFRGRETPERSTSRCPEPSCCRSPSPALARRWAGVSTATARTPSSLLATAPVDFRSGVDTAAVYQFLEANAPDQEG